LAGAGTLVPINAPTTGGDVQEVVFALTANWQTTDANLAMHIAGVAGSLTAELDGIRFTNLPEWDDEPFDNSANSGWVNRGVLSDNNADPNYRGDSTNAGNAVTHGYYTSAPLFVVDVRFATGVSTWTNWTDISDGVAVASGAITGGSSLNVEVRVRMNFPRNATMYKQIATSDVEVDIVFNVTVPSGTPGFAP
jgi:hypothetical protein